MDGRAYLINRPDVFETARPKAEQFCPTVRDEYFGRSARVDKLREGAARNRIDYELLRTSEPLDAALFAYLARRSHLG